MKILKKILLALAIASSIGVFSTQALAGEGRVSYKPIDAINNILKQIRATIDAIEAGAEGEQATAMIKKCLAMSKEIYANDKVDRARSRANKHLKAARTEAKKEELQIADEHLRKAYKGFEGLKKLL